jgi:hypothetical protein
MILFNMGKIDWLNKRVSSRAIFHPFREQTPEPPLIR